MSGCVICNAHITPFISFGDQPIANRFLTPDEFGKEYFYKLEVAFCPNCYMVQLTSQPKREEMFNQNYAFFSGTSSYMRMHFQEFARHISQKYLTKPDSFVVEIGSNDGTMLQNFAHAKIRHLGIEPSANVAQVAINDNVQTWSRFFDKQTAELIVKEYGKADVLLAANVMCHIPYQHSILEGVNTLLKTDGVVAFEDPYIGDVIQKVSYDQIYDEHMFLFSLHSVKHMFAMHDMELIDAVPQPTHGGSMRYFLARNGEREVSSNVRELLEKEEKLGLTRIETFLEFSKKCERSKADFVSLLQNLKQNGKRVVGYAATSKSTTVLNYCRINSDLIEMITDSTPIKQGKYTPGMHIPVVASKKFRAPYPDYAVLFGWNHKAEILAKEQDFTRQGGRWITFVPRVEVIND